MYFLPFICFSQNSTIDSLSRKLRQPLHDTSRAAVYVALSEEYAAYKPDTVIPLCNKALEITGKNTHDANATEKKSFLKTEAGALNNIGYIHKIKGDLSAALSFYKKSLAKYEQTGDKQGIARAFNNLGSVYNNQGNISEALHYFKQSLKIKEDINDSQGAAHSLNNIGYIYKDQGNITAALEYYGRSLKLYEAMDDKKGIALALNNMAGIYNDQGDVSSAINYYKRSLSIREALGDKRRIATSLNNLGGIYQQQGDIETALKHYERSLSIREGIGDKQGIAFSLGHIGVVHAGKGDITTALEFFSKGLKIQEEIGDKEGIAISLNYIGGMYLNKKDYKKAEEYCYRSLKVAQELGYPNDIRNAAENLKKIYKEQAASANTSLAKKTEFGMKALLYYELFIQMRDSINNQETRKAAVKKQMQYEYEKKEASALAEREKKDIQHHAELKKRTLILWSVAGGLLLALAFGLYILRSLRNTRRQKVFIEQQKKLVDEKQKEILDSIRYAKRIQTSLLTPENYIGRTLNNLRKKEGN